MNSKTCRWMSVLAAALLMHGAAGQDQAAPPEGFYLNAPRFEIPFNVERSAGGPVEVQLLVSRDAGQSWQLVNRQPASAGAFPFTSDEDGNYWFATRTIDNRGAAFPSGKPTPQLMIVLDRSGPQVDAEVDADSDGRIRVDYTVTDAAPLSSGIQVEYQTDSVPQWLPVTAPDQPQRQETGDSVGGQLSWNPEAAWQKAHVRIMASDKAGNRSIIVRQVSRPRVAQAPVQLASNGVPRTPAAAVGAPVGSSANARPDSEEELFTDGRYAIDRSLMPQMRGAAAPGVAAAYPAGPLIPPAQGDPARGPASGGAAAGVQVPHPLPGMFTAAPSADTAEDAATGSPVASKPLTAQEAMRPLEVEQLPVPQQRTPQPSGPRIERSLASQTEAAGNAAPGTAAAVGPQQAAADVAYRTTGVPLRASRSRQFSLEYEIEAAGARGVQEVELWGTRDGGQSWMPWGVDEDRLSPFDIEVSGEGVYGFRIVVVAGNGLASPRPLAGEPADVEVLVDTVGPELRLVRAQYGRGDESGSLLIGWTCSDPNLEAHPITLSFAPQPDGPWTTIAAGLENNGQYKWPADPQLPRQIYLRVEARDKAGNVAVDVLDVPIAVEGLAPRARIRGFSPIESGGDDAARSASRPGASGPQKRLR